MTEGQKALLKKDVQEIIDRDRDFVIIYSMKEGVKLDRDIITNTPDPADNFI